MSKDATKVIGTPIYTMTLESYVKVLISEFLMSILFFLLMTLAVKADTRTSELIKNPFPYIIIGANIAGAIFHIYFIISKKIEFSIISSIVAAITIVLCNIVLGYSSYAYLNTLGVDKLLILMFAWVSLKYIVPHVIRYIYKLINLRNIDRKPE